MMKSNWNYKCFANTGATRRRKATRKGVSYGVYKRLVEIVGHVTVLFSGGN